MTIPALLAAAASGAEHAGENPAAAIAREFGLSGPLFISQCISFLLVVGILWKFAYGPILKALEERRQKIAEGLANAEKIKAQLADAEQRFNARLAEANAQAQRLIEEARDASASLRDKKTQEAIAEAETIIAKARETTTLERDKILSEVKSQLGLLVVKTTAKVVGKVLTPEDQRRIAEETAKEIAA